MVFVYLFLHLIALRSYCTAIVNQSKNLRQEHGGTDNYAKMSYNGDQKIRNNYSHRMIMNLS